MAMDCRTGIGFGDYQPVPGACMATHFLAELDRPATALIAGQNAEAGSLDRRQKERLAAFFEFVFTVTEESEVVTRHPLQQGISFDAQRRICTYWPAVQ